MAVVLPASAQAPSLRALAQIEPGRWQLRDMDDGTSRSMCVTDPRTLLQLRHATAGSCSRFVIEDAPRLSTVHYTCAGAGHGRTSITIETPRLIRITTQGLAGGLPFETRIEARRTGSCGTT
ncbi:DUF3617 domain-containing protein [Sphingomonas baiyangensis]|uniref:DUF3617 family protein n=1 Tax=Sphingomonas baiyangensis TaxID=2572576 RepID=A0A4U1L511_9SPHN|nr:hypothetical protein [Sphingomonas baiyangensis]TKD51276.1 hypothetical protein FBR43_11310 [Sphingomonas baiyangensis]